MFSETAFEHQLDADEQDLLKAALLHYALALNDPPVPKQSRWRRRHNTPVAAVMPEDTQNQRVIAHDMIANLPRVQYVKVGLSL